MSPFLSLARELFLKYFEKEKSAAEIEPMKFREIPDSGCADRRYAIQEMKDSTRYVKIVDHNRRGYGRTFTNMQQEMEQCRSPAQAYWNT